MLQSVGLQRVGHDLVSEQQARVKDLELHLQQWFSTKGGFVASIPTPGDLAMFGVIVPFMRLGHFYHTRKQEKKAPVHKLFEGPGIPDLFKSKENKLEPSFTQPPRVWDMMQVSVR